MEKVVRSIVDSAGSANHLLALVGDEAQSMVILPVHAGENSRSGPGAAEYDAPLRLTFTIIDDCEGLDGRLSRKLIFDDRDRSATPVRVRLDVVLTRGKISRRTASQNNCMMPGHETALAV